LSGVFDLKKAILTPKRVYSLISKQQQTANKLTDIQNDFNMITLSYRERRIDQWGGVWMSVEGVFALKRGDLDLKTCLLSPPPCPNSTRPPSKLTHIQTDFNAMILSYREWRMDQKSGAWAQSQGVLAPNDLNMHGMRRSWLSGLHGHVCHLDWGPSGPVEPKFRLRTPWKGQQN
jgi:hypothetical protein